MPRPTPTGQPATQPANQSPPKPELKQERAVRTRAQILSAAAKAFADKGYPAVTMLDIAELAGVTKGAVYFHFANKESVAAAVAEQFYERLPKLADEVEALGLDPLETIRELLIRTAVMFRDDEVAQAGARLQIEKSLIGVPLPLPFVGSTDLLIELLVRAKGPEDALPGGTKPDAVARVLATGFFGLQHVSWILTDRADIVERVEELIATVIPRPPGRGHALTRPR